ncbi:MAG: hypothetical protein HOP11_12425 [Saprospiraceae bacterium]|nr:hypothetical protein [Saprospiraceae bacterium]
METILPYLLNTVLGAGGGWLGNMIKKNGLGMLGNLIAGGAGGNILPMILSAAGSTIGAAPADGGMNWIGLIISLLGGSAGSLLGGLFKKA